MKIFRLILFLLWQLFMNQTNAQENRAQVLENDTISIKDYDKDRISDSIDKCPEVKGLPIDDGCPIIKWEYGEVGFDEIPSDLRFPTKGWKISEDYFEILNKLVLTMTRLYLHHIKIDGYCDKLECRNENKAIKLSRERAYNVMKYLESKGIDKSRIIYNGYGASNFCARNDTETGRKLNRRVVLKLYIP